MREGNSIINFGDLSKPATVLIEKVSDAIGALYKPRHIKRVAEAEAEAEKIKALAGIEVSEIQQRALVRLVQEEGKKQENIENITSNAAKQLGDNAKPENMEEDWISHFFEKSRNISDKEMQGLWSRLLAGEANKPGSYSKRTIDLVSSLDKPDANLFTQLCTFAIASGDLFPLVLDYQADIYVRRGINFGTLNHLDSLGLIKFNSLQNFMLQKLPKNITLFYSKIPIIFKLKEEADNTFEIGHVMLTKSGQQLAPICGATIDIKFVDYLLEFYSKKQIEVVTPFPPKTS
jgi:hypothetical protein